MLPCYHADSQQAGAPRRNWAYEWAWACAWACGKGPTWLLASGALAMAKKPGLLSPTCDQPTREGILFCYLLGRMEGRGCS